jgi:hypothetical protein
VETVIIRQQPSGGYIEETRPVTQDMRAMVEARTELQQLAGAAQTAAARPARRSRRRTSPAAGAASAGCGWHSTGSSPKASRWPTPATTVMAPKPASSQGQLPMRRTIPGMSRQARKTQSAKSTAPNAELIPQRLIGGQVPVRTAAGTADVTASVGRILAAMMKPLILVVDDQDASLEALPGGA